VPLLLLAANAVLLLAVEREDLRARAPARTGRSSRALRSDTVLRLLVGVAFLYGLTESIYGNWAVPYLT
jgi:hypothetical protein